MEVSENSTAIATDPLIEYKRFSRKKTSFQIITGGLLVFTALFSIFLGAADLSASEVTSALLGIGSGFASTIVWNIRLPRILCAITAGAGLSIAGGAMQSILRNPLGSPFILGISQSAAFGAAFAIVVLGAGTIGSDGIILNNIGITALSAFAWSLVATLIIFTFAKCRGASPEAMVLAGVAIGSLFTAGITAIEYFASDVELVSIIFWTFGDTGRATWGDVGAMALIVIPSAIYFVLNGLNYNALDAGEETAKSLGIRVERLRLVGLLIASFLTAFIVSIVGIIGFVGLVVPHIVRKITGGEGKNLGISSALVGGLLLLASDTVARTLISPVVLPVGILTSFLGAPLFLYLIIRGREYW